MENQNIQWQTWEEQPQKNEEQTQQENIPMWGEQSQPQQQQPVSWGEQPQDQSRVVNNNWGEQPLQENIPTWGEQPIPNNLSQEQPPMNWEGQPLQPNVDNSYTENEDFRELEVRDWEMKTSLLGLLPKLKIESLVYKVDYNNEQVTQDLLNNNLTPLDNDGKYTLKPQEGTELNKVLFAIKNIAETRGMKVKHSFVYKNSPNESSINISRGECRYNYLYFSQASFNSGDVVLDLSAINGPSEQLLQASPGLLLLLPGWVPYRITKNLSNKDMIAIGGRLSEI